MSLKVQLKATRNRNDTKFLYVIQHKIFYCVCTCVGVRDVTLSKGTQDPLSQSLMQPVATELPHPHQLLAAAHLNCKGKCWLQSNAHPQQGQWLLNTHRNHWVPLLHMGARKHKDSDTQNALKPWTPTGICTQCTNEDEEFVMKKLVFGEKNTFYTEINI